MSGVEEKPATYKDSTETDALSNLSILITKGTTPTTYGHSYCEDGIPFLRVENISEDGKVDTRTALRISQETHDFLRRSQLKAVDLLITIAGTIGRTAVIRNEDIPANCNQAVAIVRPYSAKIASDYLKHFIGSREGQRILLGDSVQLAQANLSLEKVGELRIPRLDVNRHYRKPFYTPHT